MVSARIDGDLAVGGAGNADAVGMPVMFGAALDSPPSVTPAKVLATLEHLGAVHLAERVGQQFEPGAVGISEVH